MRPFHVGCQDKSDPGKIHEMILVCVLKNPVAIDSRSRAVIWVIHSALQVLHASPSVPAKPFQSYFIK